MTILRTNVDFCKKIFSDRIGDPYVYGGNWDPFNLKTGTDCSGLVGDCLDACLFGTAMPWQRSVSTESWPYDYDNNTPAAPGTVGPKGTIAIASPSDAPSDAAAIVAIHHGGGGANSHTNIVVDGTTMESNGSNGTCTLGNGAIPQSSSYWTDFWYLPGPISDTVPASPAPQAPLPAVTPTSPDTTWADIESKLDGVFHTTHIIYTVQGTGQPDPTGPGYPADVARTLNPNVWTWQGVGNYPATAFPMNKSIAAGEAELVRLITEVHPDRTFALMGYSQGAIITSNVYDRIRNGDLQQFKDQLIGGVTWGNPRREQGHTIPGGIDPGGHGIVTPNLVDTDVDWWDFAAGSKMVGSPGQDLYTTTGYNGSPLSVTDMEAVWKIVDEGTITSVGDLFDQVISILGNPALGTIAAITAAVDALDFFVVKGITPHTSYQFTQPIAGDPRDCWRLAVDHLNELGARVPARIVSASDSSAVPSIAAAALVAPAATTVPAIMQDAIQAAEGVVTTAATIVPKAITEVPAITPTVPANITQEVVNEVEAVAPSVVTKIEAGIAGAVPVTANAATPTTTNGATVSTAQVTQAVNFLKELPAIIKSIISFLTIAGTIIGAVTSAIPAASGGTTAALAGAGGAVGAIIQLLLHRTDSSIASSATK